MNNQQSPILFFDGVCNTCNAFIDFLMRIDPLGTLRFASLQGDTAKKYLPHELITELNTLVLRDAEGKLYQRSEAVWRVFAALPNSWRLVALFRFIPRFIRDFFYSCFARYRYLLFGKRDTCRVATAEERARILD